MHSFSNLATTVLFSASGNGLGFIDSDVPARIRRDTVKGELSTQPGMEITVLPQGTIKINKKNDPEWDDEKDEPFNEDSENEEDKEEEKKEEEKKKTSKRKKEICLLYTSPSPRD